MQNKNYFDKDLVKGKNTDFENAVRAKEKAKATKVLKELFAIINSNSDDVLWCKLTDI